MLEKQIEEKVLKYLNQKLAFAGKFDATAILTDRRSKFYTTKVPKGWPDLACYTDTGRLVLCEVKTPKTWASGLSLAQLTRLIHAIENSCIAFCTHSVEHAEMILTSVLDKESTKLQQQFLLSHLPPKYSAPIGRTKRVMQSQSLIGPALERLSLKD